MGDEIIASVASSLLDPDYVCAHVLPLCSEKDFEVSHAEQYVNELLERKPKEIKDNNYINNLYWSIKG